MTQPLERHYHVFVAKYVDKESKENAEMYVAEGPTTAEALVGTPAEFAEDVIASHGFYLQDHGKPITDIDLTFSFTPPYEKALNGSTIYSTRRFTEKEEKEFLDGLVKFTQTYCTPSQ